MTTLVSRATFQLPAFDPHDPASNSPFLKRVRRLCPGAQEISIKVLADFVSPPKISADKYRAHFRGLVLICFSAPDQSETCISAFSSDPDAVSWLCDRGCEAVDADIYFADANNPDAEDIRVCTLGVGQSGHVFQPGTCVLTIKGLRFMLPPSHNMHTEPANRRLRPSRRVTVNSRQQVVSPTAGEADTLVTVKDQGWKLQLESETAVEGAVSLKFNDDARFPSFAPLDKLTFEGTQSWASTLVGKWDPFTRNPRKKPVRAAREHLEKREDLFGKPCFHFEDVEVVGFRINLDRHSDDATKLLEELVRPLNFHLQSAPTRPIDFEYRAASRTIVVELLRYGRMRLDGQEAPLGEDDYQCQHELLIRVLVGRVDDSTSQARSPAVFVPAIFVDNPWSRLWGREVQGFDKRLAAFMSKDSGVAVTLRPDGKFGEGAKPVPLSSIDSVKLARWDDIGDPLLELGRSYRNSDLDSESDFQEFDPAIAMRASALSGVRWRQADFKHAEFRRSFARGERSEGLVGFRSVQVAPVNSDRELPHTWISAAFSVRNVRVAFPSDIATVRPCASDYAPAAWNSFAKSVQEAPIALPAGEWYRMRMDMTMKVDDGLAW